MSGSHVRRTAAARLDLAIRHHGPDHLDIPRLRAELDALGAVPTGRDRVRWRSVGAGATSLGTPLVLGMLHPLLGEVIASIEIAVILMVIAVVLFGSKETCERAFRLLRWFGNRPEPPAPNW
ncbi:MAG TPA: hypothetical protein VMV92_42380 [Streptosporangiaceae bacterium]|nr:hypothetical protein [Streptosporangiaceae bacterium]